MDGNRSRCSKEVKGAPIVAFYLHRAWDNAPAGIAQLFEVIDEICLYQSSKNLQVWRVKAVRNVDEYEWYTECLVLTVH